MACDLDPAILCSSIASLRVAEDAVTALLMAMIIWLLLDTAYNMIKQGPLYRRVIAFALAFLPFLLWKLLGAMRRIFLYETSRWYTPLYEFGEIMEALTALFVLAALVYMYLLLKPDKIKG